MVRKAVGTVGEPRIPVFLAVGFWAASGLAVLGYTYIAFMETATDAERALQIAGSPLIANEALLAAQGTVNEIGNTKKPLNRNKFDPSPEALGSLLRNK